MQFMCRPFEVPVPRAWLYPWPLWPDRQDGLEHHHFARVKPRSVVLVNAVNRSARALAEVMIGPQSDTVPQLASKRVLPRPFVSNYWKQAVTSQLPRHVSGLSELALRA